MISGEISNSGRFSGGRSNFSQMCTLLSQYLKERGSFGDLKLGTESRETMDLFPISQNSGQDFGSRNQLAADTKKNSFPSGPETAQMTIFYGGQVMVFDDFPADKAQDIMDLASSKSSAAVSFGLDSDLPIARKNSLSRFLEKRKDRSTANAPYPFPATKPRAEAWLLPGPPLRL